MLLFFGDLIAIVVVVVAAAALLTLAAPQCREGGGGGSGDGEGVDNVFKLRDASLSSAGFSGRKRGPQTVDGGGGGGGGVSTGWLLRSLVSSMSFIFVR